MRQITLRNGLLVSLMFIGGVSATMSTTATAQGYNRLSVSSHKDGEPYDTYRGLVMAGYQGWFCVPGIGCKHTGWVHYENNSIFAPGTLRNSIDYWPDVSEYEKSYEVKAFHNADGTTPRVFSSFDRSSVLLHFKWMQEYGIDGVFVQRFVSAAKSTDPRVQPHLNAVLEHCMEGSNMYGRAFAVMYDLGGFMDTRYPDRDVAGVLADARKLVEEYRVCDRTKQKYYLYENGKPLIALWGVGQTNRGYTMQNVSDLIDGLRDMGFSIMLGTPIGWRTPGVEGCIAAGDEYDRFMDILSSKTDVIMPWYAGRFTRGGIKDFANRQKADLAWCNNHGVLYAPLCFPGYSDRNMYPDHTNVRDREEGMLLWAQMYNVISMGCEAIYIAMFDEIDEGTQIMKCMRKSEVPVNLPDTEYWVNYISGARTMTNKKTEGLTGNDWSRSVYDLNIPFQGYEDNVETDHYLWVTGLGAAMLRGEVELSATLPVRTSIHNAISELSQPQDAGWYTLDGVRHDAPVKGINIHQGKKIIVK